MNKQFIQFDKYGANLRNHKENKNNFEINPKKKTKIAKNFIWIK